MRRYAAAFGWIDRVCAVRDSQGRLTVELYGEGIDDIMKQVVSVCAKVEPDCKILL